MRFFTLAFRNVFRARARTGITVGALFFGLLMSLLLGAFILGSQRSFVGDIVLAKAGAIQVHRKGYFELRDRQPLKLSFAQGGALEQQMLSTPGVTGATPRIVFSGMVTNGRAGTAVTVRTSEPSSDAAVLPEAYSQVLGKHLSNDAPRGVLIGAELASALGAKEGSSLMLQAQGPGGRENALDLDVNGTMVGFNPLEGKRALTITLQHAQSLLGMSGQVTEYAIGVRDLDRADEVAAALRAKLGPDYEVHTWAELYPAIVEAMRFQQIVLGFISFVFLAVAIFGVANTLLMSVMERTREIGTLLAVGVRRSQVARLFVLEAAVQAFLGVGLSLLISLAIVTLVNARGGIMMPTGEGQMPFRMSPELGTGFVLIAASATFVGALLAALYPAARAARLRPVEALATA